jgi:hypothetical protein
MFFHNLREDVQNPADVSGQKNGLYIILRELAEEGEQETTTWRRSFTTRH